MRFAYSACHREARAAIRDAFCIVVLDPVWGRQDQLWPVLERFANETETETT